MNHSEILITFTVRLISAMILGGIIGLEREYRSKDAGFRTHFLVSLGAALFTLISIYAFDGPRDTARVAAQIVSGIGFLGAGLIVFQRNVVRGLTTAAGLWVTAAVGMACGTGQYFMAVLVAVLVLVGLEILGKFVHRGGVSCIQVSFSSPSREQAQTIIEKLRQLSARVYMFEMKAKHTSQGVIYDVQMEVRLSRLGEDSKVLDYLRDMDDVSIAALE